MNKKGFDKSETLIFALGGLGEVGKNMYCFQDNDSIIIIDCGIKFPSPDLLGIDYIINDFSYLKENEDKIKALIVTHGHEDHIGAIPFLLKSIKIPQIICSEITNQFILNKLKDKGGKPPVMKIVNSNETVKIDKMTINFVQVIHSIPGTFAIVVETKNGRFMYTADFKIDYTPIDKEMELIKLLELSKKGLTCLLSDSTNAEVSRISISELEISKNLDKVLKQAESRVIISTFASSLDRVKSAIEASAKYDRKVVIFGRSMEKGVALARKVKYIDVPNTIIITPEQIKSTPPEKLTIICTGSQGEELAALNRMANGQHKHISLNPDDLVVFSSSPIPGNTMFVNRVINKLMRANVKIITNSPDFPIHASGHGTKEDLKAMLAFTKPKYFIPAHGEYKMLIEHGKIARDVGVKKENIFIIKNGDIVAFKNGKGRKAGVVTAGITLIDGDNLNNHLDTTNFIKDRKILSEDGLISISIVINKHNKLAKKPYALSKGFIFVKDNQLLISKVEGIATRMVKSLDKDFDIEKFEADIVHAIGKLLFDETRRQPMIIPIISKL